MFEFGKILGGLSDNFNILYVVFWVYDCCRCWDVYGIQLMEGWLYTG